MEYFKLLVLMDGERIKLTPDQFQAITVAQARGDKHILVNGNMLALSSISRSEDTSEPLPSLALPGSADANHKHEPEYIEQEGNYRPAVKMVLVKQRVNRKRWESMSHSSFNHLLEDEGQWVWVAFWHAPCKTCGITRPDTYECSPEDYRACGYRWPQNADV